MNLKDFISQSLVEIVDGVSDARKRVTGSAGIAPKHSQLFVKSQSGGTNLALGYDEDGNIMHVVDFDVAVTARDETGTKGGIGVVGGVFALGSQGESANSSESVSRLRFRVPISFPIQNEE